MKRFITIPLVIFLLCGCTTKKQITPVVNNLSFIAEVVYDEQNYVCDILVDDDGLNLVVCEPGIIKDLTLKIDENGVTTQFKGVSHTSDINLLQSNAVAQILFNTLTDVSDKTFNVNDQNCEITGQVNSKKYVFTFSPTGLPLSLIIDDINLNIKFSNVTLK